MVAKFMKKIIVFLSSIFTLVLFFGCKSFDALSMLPFETEENSILKSAKSIQVAQTTSQVSSECSADAAKSAQYFHNCLVSSIEYNDLFKIKKAKADIVLQCSVTDFSYDILSNEEDCARAVYFTVLYTVKDKNGKTLLSDRANIRSVSPYVAQVEFLAPSFDVMQRKVPVLADRILGNIKPFPKRIALIVPKKGLSKKARELNKAYDSFSKGEYKNAKNEYFRIYNEMNLFEAGYNAVRIMQIRGEYADALVLAEKIFASSKDRLIAIAIDEIEKEIESKK